eukprot:TRINITY_DN1346_c0_g1_i1.p1 TRINITY_DN1346_c0_g1~~TRINITY_DN1346_c0_g1_i1.p1  ORF type:complete len:101 (+),score=9.65 TRINITY_DN1346_c0_g1_i1:139-441(+)
MRIFQFIFVQNEDEAASISLAQVIYDDYFEKARVKDILVTDEILLICLIVGWEYIDYVQCLNGIMLWRFQTVIISMHDHWKCVLLIFWRMSIFAMFNHLK